MQLTKLYDQVPLTVCIAADARMESLPAFPQARKLGPQRPVFGRIPVLPRASDVSQHCTAGHLANSLVLPALERIGVKGKMVDQNHDDVLMKLFRNQKFSEFKSASVTDENVSRGSKHQQKGLSLGTVLYGGRACPEPTAMINAGYKYVKADAQGSRGWKSMHVPTYEVLDREVGSLPQCCCFPLKACLLTLLCAFAVSGSAWGGLLAAASTCGRAACFWH